MRIRTHTPWKEELRESHSSIHPTGRANNSSANPPIHQSIYPSIRRSECGSILVITLVFCTLVGLVLTAYLSMLKSQHKFTYRSQVWNDCVATCEAGIEEAMSHINYSGTTSNFAINGWVFSSGAYRKQRNVNGGFVRMAIDTAIPPTITVTGYLRGPVQTNHIVRALQLKTKLNQRFPHAILARGNVTCNSSGARVDSFDSTDPAKSTAGQYDPSKAGDHATVATVSQNKGAIDIGNLELYGKAGTGPGGTVTLNNGNVGSTAWNNDSANNGTIEPGHFSDDVNMYIPQPTLPTGFGNNLPILNGLIGLITHNYILGNGDYRLNNLNITSGQDLYVTGQARLFVNGAVNVGGVITLAPGASLEIYSAGNIDVSGSVNNPGLPKDFGIIGLSTCTVINYNGGAKYVGTMNAPRANITITGGAGFYGAAIGNIVKLTGGMSVHYDESLKGNPNEGRYLAAAYQEL